MESIDLLLTVCPDDTTAGIMLMIKLKVLQLSLSFLELMSGYPFIPGTHGVTRVESRPTNSGAVSTLIA